MPQLVAGSPVALRPYQLRAVELLRECIAERPILCIATGSGKTVIAAEIIRLALARGRTSLLVAHRRELILQARDRLAAFGIRAGVIMPGWPRLHLPVQVASIQTLARRRKPEADLVLVDEAHHSASASYTALLACYPQAWLVGFTATPARLDGRGLRPPFGRIVEPVSVRELIDQGYLIEPTVFAPPAPDLAGMRKARGDYADRLELGRRMDKLTGSVVEHYRRHCDGWPAVLFACNTAHSRHVTDELRAAGYRWVHLDAATPRAERAQALRDLASGAIHGVSNCDLLGEGVDVPALRCAILARPTLSLTVHRQQQGRIMRPPGPCVVLDHAGNTHRHGRVTDPVEWSLDERARKPAPALGVRSCPKCYVILAPTCRTCPECGHEFQSEPDIPIPAAGQLVAVTVRAEDPREVYAGILRVASDRGFKVGWARGVYYKRFGLWPQFYKLEREIYVCTGHEWEQTTWGTRCARCRIDRASFSAEGDRIPPNGSPVASELGGGA